MIFEKILTAHAGEHQLHPTAVLDINGDTFIAISTLGNQITPFYDESLTKPFQTYAHSIVECACLIFYMIFNSRWSLWEKNIFTFARRKFNNPNRCCQMKKNVPRWPNVQVKNCSIQFLFVVDVLPIDKWFTSFNGVHRNKSFNIATRFVIKRQVYVKRILSKNSRPFSDFPIFLLLQREDPRNENKNRHQV